MVTHTTRTPPEGIFHIFVSIVCFTSLSGSNGDSLGRGPMEKIKKKIKTFRENQKNKKKTHTKKNKIWGFFGERPHGENKKKNSRKPKKFKKNNIWGLFGGTPHGE